MGIEEMMQLIALRDAIDKAEKSIHSALPLMDIGIPSYYCLLKCIDDADTDLQKAKEWISRIINDTAE